jgi:hypothetical protein
MGNQRDQGRRTLRYAPETILAIDQGYTDYAWFLELTQEQVYFVTRMKRARCTRLKMNESQLQLVVVDPAALLRRQRFFYRALWSWLDEPFQPRQLWRASTTTRNNSSSRGSQQLDGSKIARARDIDVRGHIPGQFGQQLSQIARGTYLGKTEEKTCA